ncbi:hypothetical protein NMG60_11004124 [Bertholletia excelsa]
MSHNTKPTSTTTTTTTTSRVNGTQACAACKYRRSKCASDCILAPYFPHDRHHQFRNAHKLFGVSNITKIIQNLDPQQKDAAMQTIIYQSDVRAADPVGGCFRIIQDLSHQIEVARAELDLVLQQLALCRAFAAAAAAPAQPLPPPDGSPVTEFDALDPLLGYDPNDHNQLHQSHGEEYILEENHAMPLQGGVGGAAGWTMQDDVVAAPEEAESGFSHEKESLVRECEDFKPAIIDLGEERLVLKFDHEEEIIQQRYVL